MPNLRITEIKAFVPAKDFEISKQFYKDLVGELRGTFYISAGAKALADVISKVPLHLRSQI